MDPVDLIQKTLSTIAVSMMSGESNANGTEACRTNTTSPSTSTAAALPGAFAVSTIISFLFSYSALRDWLKLIVIGGAIETCRRVFFGLWRNLKESLWITASFDDDDSSYDWMMYWLSQQPKWAKARTVDVTTRSFGLISPAIDINEKDPISRKISYLPSFSETYTIWYKGHYLEVSRQQSQNGLYRMKESLQFMILSWNHDILNQLLIDAKLTYHAAQDHLISIYTSDTSNWRHVASRPKRPLQSIVLDPGIKDRILEDARDFLDSKSWYQERGIPFRRGYLLYGAPGSGKTSLIHSLAGELGLDVYVITLSRVGLDDTSLAELISELPEKCIALMEDIDAAFHHGLTRDSDPNPDEEGTEGKANSAEEGREKEKPGSSSPASRITLSGLLNALDGVAAQEGRILFATTNRYLALDPALCRPGRMDLHIEFKLASKYQAGELFKRFYLPTNSEIAAEEQASLGELKKSEGDSGYATSSGGTTPAASPKPDLISFDDLSTLTLSASSSLPSTSPSPTSLGPPRRQHSPKLTRTQIEDLAARFSDTIPERHCSMASLQGYLMAYKTRPYDAVENARDWVEKDLLEKAKKRKGNGSANAQGA